MLCVPIAERGFSGISRALEACSKAADMAEIRLDHVSSAFGPEECGNIISLSPIPLLFTCRKQDEGGEFRGSEEERVSVLAGAVEAGAEYIDVELQTDAELRDSVVAHAHERGCKVIISWHNFSETPSTEELEDILSRQVAAGADIAKIVTMGRERTDIPRLFSLYYRAQSLDIPLIAFCMGGRGRLSRIACLAMGAFLSFASLDAGSETAPGQIPLNQFRKILEISG